MVMEISFSTMFFHDHPLDSIFDAVQMSSADTLEFWPETPDWWLNGLSIERLEKLVKIHHLSAPLSVHAPVLDLNPCSINPDVAQISIDWIAYSIGLAETLGAGVCTIHPGRRTSKRPPSEADFRRLDHMLDSIAPAAEESNVCISIENMEPQVNALLSSPSEVALLLRDRDWLSFTLDACHVSVQGEDTLGQFIYKTNGRIANVHLSGASGHAMHLPAFENPWAECSLQILNDFGYDGLVTLEINDLSVDKPMSFEEKIAVLSRDVAFVRDLLS